MADTIIGFSGQDFTIIAADATASFSIILMKHDEDKLMHLDDFKILACGGESGDRVQFTEYIQKNLNLYRFREGRALSTHAAAHYIRRELAYYLRNNPYNVNMLLGGYDEEDGPSLYYMDYLGSLQKINHAAHGYGSYFSLSILDKYWRPDLSPEEALNLMKLCLEEVQRRLVLNSPNFIVKIVNKSGVHKVDLPASADASALEQSRM